MEVNDPKPINPEDLHRRRELYMKYMKEKHRRLAYFLFEQISGQKPQQALPEDKKWVGRKISRMFARHGAETLWVEFQDKKENDAK